MQKQQSNNEMDKCDRTKNNVYEADTSFSIVKRKRPVDTAEAQVRPNGLTHFAVFYTIVCALIKKIGE